MERRLGRLMRQQRRSPCRRRGRRGRGQAVAVFELPKRVATFHDQKVLRDARRRRRRLFARRRLVVRVDDVLGVARVGCGRRRDDVTPLHGGHYQTEEVEPGFRRVKEGSTFDTLPGHNGSHGRTVHLNQEDIFK